MILKCVAPLKLQLGNEKLIRLIFCNCTHTLFVSASQVTQVDLQKRMLARPSRQFENLAANCLLISGIF